MSGKNEKKVRMVSLNEEGITGWDEEDYEEDDDEVVWEPPTFHKSKR